MGHHDGSKILSESREFARRGDFSKASQLATACLKEGQQEPLDAATYAGLIEVFSRAKRLDKARYVLEEMKSKGIAPTLAAYAGVVLAANRPNTISTADAIYDKLVDEGVALDAQFYDAYMSALVGARKFQRAHQIYFQMSKRRKLPATKTTYKNLITIYGESKRWDLVQNVLRQMTNRNVAPEGIHYSSAVLAAAKAEGVDEAFAWVGLMEADRVKYPAPGEEVYNALIEACCLCADTVDRSWRALRNMKKAGIQPSTRSYNLILEGHSKFGRSHEIDTVLQEMAKDGVAKDSYTCPLLVRAYVTSSDLPKALEFYKEHKAAGFAPRHDLYNHLLTGLRRQVAAHGSHAHPEEDGACHEEVTETLAQADALFDEMVQTDVQLTVLAFNNLIEAHHLAGNNRRALDLYDDMKRRGVRPNHALVQLMGSIVAQEMEQLVVNGQF
jgi:pentatricopeptide repeat protein